MPSSEKRELPSGIRPLPWVTRIFWHRLVLPDRQNLHSPHSGVYSGITWSPTCSEVTPSPTSSTMPPPSWPRITGNRPSGSAPDSVNASVWQTPVATMRTSTSPAFGPGDIDLLDAAAACLLPRRRRHVTSWNELLDSMTIHPAYDMRNRLRALSPRPCRRRLRHLPAVIGRLGQQPFAEYLQAAMLLRARRIDQPIRILHRQIAVTQHHQPPGIDQRSATSPSAPSPRPAPPAPHDAAPRSC